MSFLGENDQCLVGQSCQLPGSLVVGQSAFQVVAQQTRAIEMLCLRVPKISAEQTKGVVRMPPGQGDAGRIQQRLRLTAPRFLQNRTNRVAISRVFHVEGIFKFANRFVPVLLG
ncbi:MAG: hypothetical protein ACYC3I_20040 [Gemmataceae bacterium]